MHDTLTVATEMESEPCNAFLVCVLIATSELSVVLIHQCLYVCCWSRGCNTSFVISSKRRKHSHIGSSWGTLSPMINGRRVANVHIWAATAKYYDTNLNYLCSHRRHYVHEKWNLLEEESKSFSLKDFGGRFLALAVPKSKALMRSLKIVSVKYVSWKCTKPSCELPLVAGIVKIQKWMKMVSTKPSMFGWFLDLIQKPSIFGW